ncbi:MAG: hypothetical protein OQK12_12835 [Motiliproteus sp.]|nr:hypothetical protein [Motiliproteus sp.]
MAAHVMIHLKPEDLPINGLRVLYRCGECFDKKVEWSEITEGVLVAKESCNDLGEMGICIEDLGDVGYAGFEPRTGNYWRYSHESDPEVFREHCLQIIEIMETFSPRSSWKAWQPVINSIDKDRLRLTLKNGVTGAELSYKVVNKGFGYQIKDLSNGRRVQKLLRHDYILNQLLGTSFKHLNYHSVKIETEAADDGEGGSISLTFNDEAYLLKYQVNAYDFILGLFSIKDNPMELLSMVELPHSSVIEDTRTFLG